MKNIVSVSLSEGADEEHLKHFTHSLLPVSLLEVIDNRLKNSGAILFWNKSNTQCHTMRRLTGTVIFQCLRGRIIEMSLKILFDLLEQFPVRR
jgi:hypothetical protein